VPMMAENVSRVSSPDLTSDFPTKVFGIDVARNGLFLKLPVLV